MTGAFEILSIDLEKKRIGVALVAGGLGARTPARSAPQAEIVPGARLTGKVERHEKFGVFVFLAPGRTGLIPMSETGVAREADVARGVSRRRRRRGRRPRGRSVGPPHSPQRARRSWTRSEAEEVREYTEREDAAPAEGFGSLADKLRGALKPNPK